MHRDLTPLEAELLDVIKAIHDQAVYTAKHESPGDELIGYLQTLRGHTRPVLGRGLFYRGPTPVALRRPSIPRKPLKNQPPDLGE